MGSWCELPYSQHHMIAVGDSVNLSAASLNEKSMFLGDFNAHHVTWCRATQNRAGINISDQLDSLDDYVMMNMESDEYVATTTYDTTIDLSIIHRDIAAKCNWSIYDGLSSDHFPVLLNWYPGSPLKRTPTLPKFQLHKAEWSKFDKVITAELIDFIGSDDLDDFNNQLSQILTNAADRSIPKSTPSKLTKMYWRYDLGVKCAKQDYNRANRKYRRNRTDGNKRIMVEKFEIYKDLCKSVQSNSWREWVEECNHDLDSTQLWRRLRICTGMPSRMPTHPYPIDQAENLIQQFVMRSDSTNLSIDSRIRLDNMRVQRENDINDAIHTISLTDQPFNLSELEVALQRKKETAPGEDGCTYSMIRHSPVLFKLQFLRLCNMSLENGKLPIKWKIAQLIPIPKKDGTHRPISLITVMSKVCEKMVLNRLRWNALPVNMFSLGFRSKVGTQDAIATVVSHITKADAFRKKQSAAIVMIDIEKAFEMVSPTVVLQALVRAGIKGKMLTWLQDFLTHRSGKVKFQNEKSSTLQFMNGTPQGSCLSPTLFSYVINGLLSLKLPSTVQLVAYADDLVLSCVHRDKDRVVNNLQHSLDLLNATAMSYGLQFSPAKSKAMWFYTSKAERVINLNGRRLPWSSNEKYLGIELDSRMTFTKQANNAAAKSKKNMNAMKVLSSLTAISGHILKRIYSACVQSTLEYGAIVTPLMCKTNITTLQKVQNQGMRLILGVPKWTCVTSMGQELDILPVKTRCEITVAKLVDKVKFMTSHPLHVSCTRQAIINSERSKWLIKSREIYAKLAPASDDRTLEAFDDQAPWESSPILYHVNHTINKGKHTGEELKAASLRDMQSLPDGVHYFTDGSKSESRVAAAYIVNDTASFLRLNDDATITQAELVAIWGALEHAAEHSLKAIIHTDSLTAIQILRNKKNSERSLCNYILSTAHLLKERPLINWIPSHVGIEGNELADKHAKEGLQRDVIDHHVKSLDRKIRNSIRTTATDIHHAINQDCSTTTFRFNNKLEHSQRKFLLKLPRHQQKMIYKIRLSCKTYFQIRGQNEICPYCEEGFRSRSSHWCIACPAMNYERMQIFDYLTSEEQKLKGDEFVVAVINSQNSRKYKELLQLLKKFPF